MTIEHYRARVITDVRMCAGCDADEWKPHVHCGECGGFTSRELVRPFGYFYECMTCHAVDYLPQENDALRWRDLCIDALYPPFTVTINDVRTDSGELVAKTGSLTIYPALSPSPPPEKHVGVSSVRDDLDPKFDPTAPF